MIKSTIESYLMFSGNLGSRVAYQCEGLNPQPSYLQPGATLVCLIQTELVMRVYINKRQAGFR